MRSKSFLQKQESILLCAIRFSWIHVFTGMTNAGSHLLISQPSNGFTYRTKTLLIGVVLALFSMLPVSSVAQTKIDVGFKGGASFAHFHGEDISYDVDTRNGLTVGGFLTVNVNNYLAIQPEILFVQKGTNATVSAFEFNWSYGICYHEGYWEDRLSYLETPVLVKLKIPTGAMVEPGLYVGPSFAIKLMAEEKWESTFLDSNGVLLEHGSGTEDISKRINDIDFGLAFGGDLMIDVESAKIVIEARYTLGLTRIDEPMIELDSKVGTYGFRNMKNRIIAVTAGFALPLDL
jgi:hypothetical protein